MRRSSRPFRDVAYPLNVFMYVLTHEEGAVTDLHYGIFGDPAESLPRAQERSSELVIQCLPPPPARVLDVGSGLGATLDRLTRLGYRAHGITPDEGQFAFARARYGDAIRISRQALESLTINEDYDVVLFQESAQYIGPDVIFAQAQRLAPTVMVLDEFALVPATSGALHVLADFIAAARRHGFEATNEMDLSQQAAPTVDYFNQRLPLYRSALVTDLGLRPAQVDELIASGRTYRDLYRRGIYAYRLLQFKA